ncbi:MAG: Mur ligase domain-containing protein [Opitutaceae bacterium]|jgi:UDP-N-acetylmuramate: L-alanyl-gamma-D-glutamyl-meso-diaminopimelate ligase|nr:Mur ligase domain-containing protein [Opitutaceae bacterium]
MKIYFMGICGTAMGNAALLARAAGHDVLGADAGVYPPMSTLLAAAGIALHEGYDPARLAALAPDLVVVGNAMSRGNPEVEWLLETRALPFTSLPAMLHDLVLRPRRNIVVCGTHGKTTTTALTAFLLRENGRDPGFLIGGVPQDPPTGSHLGAPADPFVIEGDEYDSAFFDKRSKFIHYAPRIAVLNNLEFDHADIFRDLADVRRAFEHLTRLVPRNGIIIANGDDPNLLPILANIRWCPILLVGTGGNNCVRITEFTETADHAAFTLLWDGAEWARIHWQLPGLYNARNAAIAAAAAALAAETPDDKRQVTTTTDTITDITGTTDTTTGTATDTADITDTAGIPHCAFRISHCFHLASPLARFRGVRRRQETHLATPALTLVEDFGHHPTAIAGTLRSFRNRFPAATLTAVFEPRSNTARTNRLQDDFARALANAHEVFLGPVHRADHLAADARFAPCQVARQLAAQNVDARAFATNAALRDALAAATLPPRPAQPRVVIFFSNGSFDGIITDYARQAGSPSPP